MSPISVLVTLSPSWFLSEPWPFPEIPNPFEGGELPPVVGKVARINAIAAFVGLIIGIIFRALRQHFREQAQARNEYLEPLSAIGGAFYSATYPRDYLSELTFPGSPVYVPPVTTQHQIAMLQLGNLFFLCGLNEFVILSSTSSTKVWKTVLFCLLLADIGHLASLAPLGTGVFWRCWEWNSMMWGGIGFVYVLAMLRVCFLLGFGLSLEGEKSAPSGTRASQSASKSTKEE